MEYTISKDDLKTLLLKCIGSKYPVKIILDNNVSTDAYIRGFVDADCSIMMISNAPMSTTLEMEIEGVKRIETIYQINFDRLRGRIFNID